MIKINYFDLGLGEITKNHSLEIEWMFRILQNITNNFTIYGFEAGKKSAIYGKLKFRKYKNIQINHLAITSKKEKVKLYHQRLNGQICQGGSSSIYDSKKNVIKNKYELVNGIPFSLWIEENNIDLDNSFNIVKINIEGAEWDFFNDIINTSIYKKIHIFCGQGHDVVKIKEFTDKGIDKIYFKLLKDHNIILHRFTEYKPEKNVNMLKLIREKIKNL